MPDWKYYNHAAVPITPPHQTPDLTPLENGELWRLGGHRPLLARWTTEFDCGHDTNWWYVIKDTPFDIAELKAKRRYEINKGIKNFDVRVIDPSLYKQELYDVQVAALSAYPPKYRPTVDRQAFFSSIDGWTQYVILGGFSRDSDQLCGYALLAQESEAYVDFKVLKTHPAQERNGINAALVYGVLLHFRSMLLDGGYICDGARSINHETEFQNYLEKYFGFRKAYCKLHISYNPALKWAIPLLFRCRKVWLKLDGVGVVHQLNAVLTMEEIARERKSL